MFTGIIQATGKTTSVIHSGEAAKLVIDAPGFWNDTIVGDSIAIDGVCLTIKNIDGSLAAFDVSKETILRSVAGQYAPGTRVNLEKALILSDRLGGHIVQGHVDGLGRFIKTKSSGENVEIEFEIPESIERYVVEKGSIAINGISLTVARIENRTITVAVIPHTLAVTNLSDLLPGSVCNMECDIISKYTEKLLLSNKGSGINETFLKEKGFL